MEAGDNLKRKNLPTMQQLRYLTELEHMGNEWGSLSMIAEKCGVSQPAVSKYLKNCVENGYLTYDYKFTELGKSWFYGYQELAKRLREYLSSIGIPEQELEENVSSLIENTNPHTLENMINKSNKTNNPETKKAKKITAQVPFEIENYGDCRVYYKIFRMKDSSPKKQGSFSMANKGFMKEAYLRQKETEQYLELRVLEVSAPSRMNGQQMKGSLDTVKYENEGVLVEAEIQSGKIAIPLRSFRFHRGHGGELTGLLPITFTCSVGQMHMPESTAVFVFWV